LLDIPAVLKRHLLTPVSSSTDPFFAKVSATFLILVIIYYNLFIE
jgi:hypothetical protein